MPTTLRSALVLKMLRAVLSMAAIGTAPIPPPAIDPQVPLQDQRRDVVSPDVDGREERLLALRQQAAARLDAEALTFSGAELADIEARYASAFRSDLPGTAIVRRPDAEPILEDLVRRYPRSNRAGCALLRLAQLSTGARRERYLRQAIQFEGDAWFENGVQVAALARAMLAVHLAGLERYDEAEQLATDLVTRFPGAIDHTGATLDGTLEAVMLLRAPKSGRPPAPRPDSHVPPSAAPTS
jgi:hypothetical protein